MDYSKGQKIRVSFETEIIWVYGDGDVEIPIPGPHGGSFWFRPDEDAKVEIIGL